MENDMSRFGYVVLCILTAVSLACTALEPDDHEPAESSSDGHAAQVTQSLTGNHKVCSAVDPSNFRDSIEVDDGWSTTTCLGWTHAVGASEWQMGCLFNNGFSWGNMNGGI